MTHVNHLARGILPTIYPRRNLTPRQGLVNIIKSVAMSAILSVASLSLLPEPAGIIAAGIIGTSAFVTIIKSIFMVRFRGGPLSASAQAAMTRNRRRAVVEIHTSQNTFQTPPPAPAPVGVTRAVDRSATPLAPPPAAPMMPAPAAQRPVASRTAAPAGGSLADALANRGNLRRAPDPKPQVPQRAQAREESGPPSAIAVAARKGTLRSTARREDQPRAAAAAPANPFANLRAALRPSSRRDQTRAQART